LCAKAAKFVQNFAGRPAAFGRGPHFGILGRKKREGDGTIGKIYSFTDAEKNGWANLFEYMGSHENVRLKFAIDKIGV
jgi:hypothetical protein